jgi:glycerol-3-phosphate dehydrogenase (NAD(P)+)
MKITVVGAGAWGTALACLLCRKEHTVTLWGHDIDHLLEVQRVRYNQRFLPDVEMPQKLRFDAALSNSVENSECIVIAVPSKFFREVCMQIPRFAGIAVTVTKGIEYETGLTMSGIVRQTMPRAQAVALSGPTFALEVARGIPAASVAAHPEGQIAQEVQSLFNTQTFRVYTSSDPLGVELGGALKNVVAIAAGVGDGLGFGDNAKAALITRALVETRRLGVACGAEAETFSGLSGVGDLTATCFSRLSRNRAFGERIGKGESVEQILSSTFTVAEGYPTARSAYQLARKVKAQTPIIDETYAALYAGKNIVEAVKELMSRDLKEERF